MPSQELTAANWVERARNGDDDACQALYDCVQNKVIPRLQMPRHLDADEVVSDTVSAVWQALQRLRDDQKILTYATTIARRVASRKLKDKKRFAPLTAAAGDGANGEPGAARDPAQRNVEREELYGSLSRSLKAADEKLFKLLYVSGASHPEAQEELGLDAPNLRKRKHRLNLKLREAAERYGF